MRSINTNPSSPPSNDISQEVIRCYSSHHVRHQSPLSPGLANYKHVTFLSNKKLSPFVKLTSRKSLCKNTLPSFLLTKQQAEDFIVNKNVNINNQEEAAKPAFSKGQHSIMSIKGPSKQEILGQISSCVLNCHRPTKKVFLRIGKIELNIEDLCGLKCEQSLTGNLIDAGLKYIKSRNKFRIIGKKEQLDRVFVVGTQDCQKIFGEEIYEEKIVLKNLLKYDVLLFPVYVGYWTLLVCSLSKKTITFYDPIGIENYDKLLKSKLFTFLKKEIKLDDSVLQSTYLRKFTYNNITESEIYDHVDSGIYILRQAFRVSLDRRAQVNPEQLTNFRYKLLYYLFKHGTKIIT